MGKIIGLTGYGGVTAGVGKDTAAKYLTDYYVRDFRSVAFADPIRAAMKAVFGWDDSYFNHPKKNEVDERFGISPRKAMQTLGTEWGRNLINTDLWLILAQQRIEPLIGAGFNVLITDVRFNNEADMIRKLGGTVWHINRKVEGGAGTEAGHSSENGVDFVKSKDAYIDNNETLGNFFYTLDNLVARLKYEEECKAKELEAAAAEAVEA